MAADATPGITRLAPASRPNTPRQPKNRFIIALPPVDSHTTPSERNRRIHSSLSLKRRVLDLVFRFSPLCSSSPPEHAFNPLPSQESPPAPGKPLSGRYLPRFLQRGRR